MNHPSEPDAFDPGSFRDPAGRVFYEGDRVLRTMSGEAAGDWEALVDSGFLHAAMESGQIVRTAETDHHTAGRVLQHDRIPLVTYPYEWSFGMLRDAALLQLDLLVAALHANLTMKDASPYNVQFVGARPVFIDVGSFGRYTPGEPWLGYRQFCQLYLYPLLLASYARIDFRPLLRGALDGVPVAFARSVLRGTRMLRPGAAVHVGMQARLTRRLADEDTAMRQALTRSGFNREMIIRNASRLRELVAGLPSPAPLEDGWTEYQGCAHVDADRGPKSEFVERVANRTHRSLAWDIGSNDGHFSRIIASRADTVAALDSDGDVCDQVYENLKENPSSANVIPLVFDVSDPSPAMGWRTSERRTLEARGRPDLVLVLAVMHHLVITDNIPLGQVLSWLRGLDAEVCFEWVPPGDPMAARLAKDKQSTEVHSDYSVENFDSLVSSMFEVVDHLDLGGRRLLHLLPR